MDAGGDPVHYRFGAPIPILSGPRVGFCCGRNYSVHAVRRREAPGFRGFGPLARRAAALQDARSVPSHPMFQVTLLDHIRLSFGGVVHSYKAHSELARRLTARLWQLRAAELALLAGALAAGITGIIQTDVRYVIASAVLCGFALALFTFYVAVNLESRIFAHRWCACRLWLVREKYRALLSEMRDGSINIETVRDRRDQLLQELHSITEHAPLVDRPAYQSARDALAAPSESALTDEEIDRFLPPSLRKVEPAARQAG